MRKNYTAAKTIAILVCLTLASGCAWFGGGGDPQQEEPEISLYLTEEEEEVQISFEEYVAGVVAAEMDPDWPREALGAQAILARTFAWRKIEKEDGEHDEYGTDASDDHTTFQAYEEARINDNVRQAVEATRGEIITYQGDAALTWFHAASGGQTCDPEEGLEYTEAEQPYIATVEEPEGTDMRPWEETFEEDEILSGLEEMGYEIESIDKMIVSQRGVSERATRFLINDETEVSAPELRNSVDPDKLKSTLIEELTVQDGSIIMSGKGHGHGVGMSQEGARTLAEDGSSAEDIIRYYYDNVDITQIWE